MEIYDNYEVCLNCGYTKLYDDEKEMKMRELGNGILNPIIPEDNDE